MTGGRAKACSVGSRESYDIETVRRGEMNCVLDCAVTLTIEYGLFCKDMTSKSRSEFLYQKVHQNAACLLRKTAFGTSNPQLVLMFTYSENKPAADNYSQ